MSHFDLQHNNAHIIGVVRTANVAAKATGSECDAPMTAIGAQVVYPYSIPEATFSATGILTTTGNSNLAAAGAAGIRNYLVGFTYQNTNATATAVLIKDNGTTIAQFHAPASMANHVCIHFPVPLRGSAAMAMTVNAGTTGASVYFNAVGFQAP